MNSCGENQAEGRPLVSISCLTYNHEKYVRKALEGFLMQKTDFIYEVLIHDDASVDSTQDIIREYEEKYPDIIKPVYQKQNQYSQGNTNINFEFNYSRAQGKYIAYCEGDDYWTDPLKLQKQVDYMEKHPDCSLCFHGIMDVDESGRDMAPFCPFDESCALTTQQVVMAQRQYGFVSFMFRREHIENLPEFYFTCPIGDVPLTLIMAAKGHLYYIKDIMACYRNQSVGSWTSDLWSGGNEEKLKKHLEDMRQVYRAFDEYTGGKYREAVEFALRRIDFSEASGMRDYKTMLKKEYRPYYKNMTPRARLGVRIGLAAPGLQLKLESVYHKIIGR